MEQNFANTVPAQIKQAVDALMAKAQPRGGELFILGCSTSEVAGSRIGTASVKELGALIVDSLLEALAPYGVTLAIGCCEHLNRAVVLPKAAALARGLELVTVRPAVKAGGACGTHYYDILQEPAMVEHVQADFGMDIGHTLIGMHLKHVAVPFRCQVEKVGCAPVVMATTRPKYIGGPRAQYPEV